MTTEVKCVYCETSIEIEPQQFKVFQCGECHKENKMICAGDYWITQKWQPEDRR